MAVDISGMFGQGHTYFADSPVVIDVTGLEWPESSPFTVVRVEVVYNGRTVGEFRGDTGGQTSISFDISSALRAIWADFSFDPEVAAANLAVKNDPAAQYFITADDDDHTGGTRSYREYSLFVYTEYLASDDGGVYTTTCSGEITGGQCAIGRFTEWERSLIIHDSKRDVSALEDTNLRNGDASTKPQGTPERVGRDSITSWVDVAEGGTASTFYPATAEPDVDHAPLVLRDSRPYTDFLFLNRRGAIETCSALTLESMSIEVETKQYGMVERPSFTPGRTLTAIGTDGRRSWQMSSGHVSREWAEWWTNEFLGGRRKRWWMLYKGPGMETAAYVPVTVEPAKKSTGIYDRAKQQMPHVDFTVTLALEG